MKLRNTDFIKFIDCVILIQNFYFFKIICGAAVQIPGIRFLALDLTQDPPPPDINNNKKMNEKKLLTFFGRHYTSY